MKRRTRSTVKDQPEVEEPKLEPVQEKTNKVSRKRPADAAGSRVTRSRAVDSVDSAGLELAEDLAEAAHDDQKAAAEEVLMDVDVLRKAEAKEGMGLSAIEVERLENIGRNQEYLKALGLGDMKAQMGMSAAAVTSARAQKARAPRPRPVPRERREATRRSGRLTGTPAPHYNEEKVIQELEAQALAEQEARMDEGPLTLQELYKAEEGGEAFLELFKKLVEDQDSVDDAGGGGVTAASDVATSSAEGEMKPTGKGKAMHKATMDYAKRLAQLALEEKDVVKLLPSRVTALAMHPSEKTLVVVAGDVNGNLGVWQVDAPTESERRVFKFRPHVDKIASMQYSPADPTQLISASHDGTVRCLDLRKEIFDLIIASGEGFADSGVTCAHIAAHSPYSLWLSGKEGTLGLLDTRNKKLAWAIEAHTKKANSVEGHPTLEHYVVTSSTDRTVKLWDARKHKAPLWQIEHTNSLNNATVDPTGSHLLITCQDHYLYVHDFSTTGQYTPKTAKHRIKHNNNTGRWLSKFWPTWDAKNPDAFTIGCLEQPRRMQVYSASAGVQIASVQADLMASVQSLTTFHPARNILVGANSSGRIHLLRGP